jgi:hypothetical protein
MKLVHVLAALPFLGILVGVTFANRVPKVSVPPSLQIGDGAKGP